MNSIGKGLFSILVLATAMSGVARAADKIVSDVSSSTEEGVTSSNVNYSFENCEEECHVATLTCTYNSITLVMADVRSENAAKAILADKKQIAMAVGGKTFDYSVSKMEFMELTGSWWLHAHEQGSKPNEIGETIAAAKSIELRAGKQKLVLPVDAKVKDWAKACR